MLRKRGTTKKNKTKKGSLLHSLIVAPPAQWMVRIARFNPLIDFSPRTHEYPVLSRTGESVLDLLYRIKHTQDGSLTFRGSCGYGGCGTCGMQVNGKPVLACVTQAAEVLDAHSTLRIDPLHDHIIKDLVVDEKLFFEELKKVKPWLFPRKNDAKRSHKMGQKDVEKLGKTPLCMLCGICNANVKEKKGSEWGPATFVHAYRYIHDSRDGNAFRMEELSPHLDVNYSIEKANLCPRDIQPGNKIAEMQDQNRERVKKKKKSSHANRRVWKE